MSEKVLREEALSPKKWRGYTLDELRYRRALTEVAIEIEKGRMARAVSGSVPDVLKGRSSGRFMLSRLLGALSYMDYMVLAWRLLRKIKRLKRH